MADRFPRYRPLGVTVPSVGSVDMTLAARTQAAGMRNIASSLDRMSAFAFKQASERAAIEGQEYGVLKAPTPEQITAAGAEGAEELFPGDDRTVFGRAAKKAAIQTAKAGIESAATKEITQLRIKAEQEGVDIQTFAQDIENVIAGYASALEGVSPVEAVNFRASMVTSANSAVLKHADIVAKAAEEAEQEDAALTIDTVIETNLPDIFAAGSTFATEAGQEYVSIVDKVGVERDKVARQAMRMGNDEDVRRELKRFDDEVDTLFTQTMADMAMVNPSQSLAEFQSGKFTSAKMRDLYKNMSPQQRTASRQAFSARLSSELSLASQIDAANATERNIQSNALVGQIAKARVSGDDATVQSLLGQLEHIDGQAYASLVEAVAETGLEDDDGVVQALNVSLFNNNLTRQKILDAYQDGDLSHTTFNNFISKLDSSSNKSYQNAMTYVKNELMPDVQVGQFQIFDTTSEKKKKAAKKVAEIENFLILHLDTNPDADPLSLVKDLVKEALKDMDDSDQNALNAANNAVQGLVRDDIVSASDSEEEMIAKVSGLRNATTLVEQIKLYHGNN